MYQADWHDYEAMHVPFILERTVIADRRAAGSQNPVFAAPFEDLETSIHWLEPIRRSLAMHLNLEDELSKRRKKVVTYLSSQEGAGLRIRDADHRALTDALNKMGRRYGYEINLVSARTSWDERMTAIVRSTVCRYLCYLVSLSLNFRILDCAGGTRHASLGLCFHETSAADNAARVFPSRYV
jgi:hypothetical protein